MNGRGSPSLFPTRFSQRYFSQKSFFPRLFSQCKDSQNTLFPTFVFPNNWCSQQTYFPKLLFPICNSPNVKDPSIKNSDLELSYLVFDFSPCRLQQKLRRAHLLELLHTNRIWRYKIFKCKHILNFKVNSF